ncbi:MAG: hypothetical protein ABI811_12025 [Acidobacteriota bacterium]
MTNNLWLPFTAGLRSEYDRGSLDFSKTRDRFQGFAKAVPEPERIPLLIETYEHYREMGVGCLLPQSQDYFWASCYSLLISALLNLKLKPTETEACAILRKSFHYCGHGGDVETPFQLAESAFEGRAYTPDLFDAVRDYEKVLKATRSTTAQNVKRKLSWIVWHDPRNVEMKCLEKCWMGCVQSDLAAMRPAQRFPWQWLLRNTTATMTGAAGKAWLKEGAKRLSKVGEAEFLAKLDRWLAFPPDGTVFLSPAGSSMLRLLVWYGSLVDTSKSLPILVRLADVAWEKKDPAGKVMGAFAWILRTHGGDAYRPVAERIAAQWGDTGEAAKLVEMYLPEEAAKRKAELEQKGAALRDLIQQLMR